MAKRPARVAPRLPLTALTRRDAAWAAVTGALAAALYATTLHAHPGLGDAPETVAGVSSLGILHAPGYPAYVLVTKLFTLLVPFGGEAFRVNLFSLVCASLSVAGVQLLARRCGAARWASAAATLCLAATSGFVFYSGFAKHDMFSGLLFLLTLHLVLAWMAQPTTRRVIALAVVLGLGLGSSWPLEVLIVPTVVFALVTTRRALALGPLVAGTVTCLAVVVALYGFVMVRAAENPAVNWGHATTFARLEDLVRRTDFTGTGVHQSISPAATKTSGSATGDSLLSQPQPAGLPAPGAITFASVGAASGIVSYGFVFADELGIAAIALAAGGLIVTLRRRRASTYPLLITFVVNLIGVAAVVSPGSSHNLTTALVQEGFLLGAYFVLVAWAAIGATELVTAALPALAGRLRWVSRPQWLAAALSAALAAVLILPSFAASRGVAKRSDPPFSDRYASTVFSQLPPHAVIFMWGAELTQPLVYRQVVDHVRPDVAVVAADGLSYPWYREELSRRLGRPLPGLVGDSVTDASRAIDSLVAVRPVYLDPQAVEQLKGHIGYQPHGLLARALPGTSEIRASSPAAVARNVAAVERVAGLPNPNWNEWPNDYVESSTYSTAELIVARTYYDAHDLAGMRKALTNVLRIEPGNQSAVNDLATLARSRNSS